MNIPPPALILHFSLRIFAKILFRDTFKLADMVKNARWALSDDWERVETGECLKKAFAFVHLVRITLYVSKLWYLLWSLARRLDFPPYPGQNICIWPEYELVMSRVWTRAILTRFCVFFFADSEVSLIWRAPTWPGVKFQCPNPGPNE